MPFLITKDHIMDPKDSTHAVGIMGPKGISPEARLLLEQHRGQKFCMYDADDILYYEGLMIHTDDELEPLRCFGANAGCTSLSVWNAVARRWDAV